MKLPHHSFIVFWSLFITFSAFGSPSKYGEPKSASNLDTVSGYYDMTPQSVSFCMMKEGQSVETCVQPSNKKIPQGILAILTDPIALILVKPETGDSVLKNPDGNGYIFTSVAMSGATYSSSISYSPVYASQPLWEDKDPCILSMNRAESGNYSKYTAPHTDTKGRSIVGRVTYNVKRKYGFSGKCNSLSTIASCYLSSQNCGGQDPVEDNQLQAMVQDFFSPFIDAGIFSVTEIPSLRMMRYEIQY